MSDTIGNAVIGVSVDATQLEAGIDKAKKSVKSLGGEIGKSVSDGSKTAERSIDAYIKKLEFSASTLGKTATETKLLELAQRGATQAQLDAAKAALTTIDTYKQQAAEARKAADAARLASAISSASQATQAKATKLTAFEMKQLSYQLNDFFVQVSSGQSPLTALVQQGSQLNGTFGGVGGTMRALGSLFTVTRVAAGSLLGVIAGLGYAFVEGRSQSADFAKALILTGNAAGLTEGKFQEMAENLAESTKTSIGSAKETLQGLVSSGKFTGDTLEETGKAVQLLSKVTGQSSEDILKQFGSMTDGVARWAETTNASYHFLTADQLQYIKTLEQQGQEQKAIEVTMAALNARLGQAAQSTNLFASAWGSVKRAASEALDVLTSIGRTETPEAKIRQIQAAIKMIEDSRSANPADQRLKAALQAQLAAQQGIAKANQESAEATAKDVQTQVAKTAFMKLQEQSLSKQQKMQKELDQANAIADKAGVSQKDRQAVLSGIRERYKELDLSKPMAGLDISAIKNAEEELKATYANTGKVLEAQRAADLVSDRQYFAQKKLLLQQNTAAEEDSLEKQIALLQSQNLSGKDKIENDKKIAEAQAALNKVRQDGAADLKVLGIQENDYFRKLELNYKNAKAAAEEYLETFRKQTDRQVDGLGRGELQRNFDDGRAQVEDRYAQQRYQLERDRRNGMFNGRDEDYQRELDLIRDSEQRALQIYANGFDRRIEKQKEWSVGASEALNNYLDESRNVALQTENLFANAFHGMEDAIVDFVMTGKASFSDFAKSVVADLIRIQVRQQLAGFLGQSGLGSLFSSGGATATVAHTGGIIGGDALASRSIPRYHSGGIAGDEVPAILQRGEGVFTKKQMAALAPADQAGGQPISISNTYHVASGVDQMQLEAKIRKVSMENDARLIETLQRQRRI